MYLTSLGIEIYGVSSEKRAIKSIKQMNQSIQWFNYCPQSSILVVSTSAMTSTLQPFYIKPQNILKLPKIDHSMAAKNTSESVEIREKDVNVLTLYETQLYVSIICHPADESDHTTIHLYRLSKDQLTVTRTHIFHTPFQGGGLALNVVDNLLIVHHQNSGTSAFFDVALLGESDGHISHHKPIGQPVKVSSER